MIRLLHNGAGDYLPFFLCPTREGWLGVCRFVLSTTSLVLAALVACMAALVIA